MKNILVIGKKSFLAKAFDFLNKKNFYSHNELKKIEYDKYDKLILLSMPKKYFKKKEKNFFFEKKILKKFENKEIHFMSTSKLYPMRFLCTEKVRKLNTSSPYTYNKYMVEKIIKKYKKKFFIYRLSNVFLKKVYSKNFFFDLLYKNYYKNKKIEFDISLKSQKDFITINSLKIIFKMMLKSRNEYGIYNIGSEKGIDMSKVISLFLDKKVLKDARKTNIRTKIVNQTLNISKITNLLNINKNDIIRETIKELKR